MMEKYNINQTTLNILDLYVNDYGKALHLREIPREAKIDVKAIQLQLKKLERLKVLSSVIKGRNKEYSLNLDNLITKYYMVLAEAYVSIRYLGENFLIKKILRREGRGCVVATAHTDLAGDPDPDLNPTPPMNRSNKPQIRQHLSTKKI